MLNTTQQAKTYKSELTVIKGLKPRSQGDQLLWLARIERGRERRDRTIWLSIRRLASKVWLVPHRVIESDLENSVWVLKFLLDLPSRTWLFLNNLRCLPVSECLKGVRLLWCKVSVNARRLVILKRDIKVCMDPSEVFLHSSKRKPKDNPIKRV